MVYTVTFNPSLDYFVSVDNFRCGRVNRTTSEKIYPGGKGINVSIVLGNLGHKSTALGFVAGFTGERIETLLSEKDICTEFIKVQNGMSRINIKLRSDEETEINGQGPFIDEEEINLLYGKLDMLEEGDFLVLAGSIPSVIPSSIYMDIMNHLENKKLKIVVDATKELLTNVLQYHPFLVKPNNHELGEIFGVKIKDKKDAVFYGRKLKGMGAVNVLVSMAAEGAVLISENGDVYEAEAPNGKLINSVGAGDSMVAGFLAGYLETGSYESAFKMSVCTGSASAFSEELATRQDVELLIKQGNKL